MHFFVVQKNLRKSCMLQTKWSNVTTATTFYGQQEVTDLKRKNNYACWQIYVGNVTLHWFTS